MRLGIEVGARKGAWRARRRRRFPDRGGRCGAGRSRAELPQTFVVLKRRRPAVLPRDLSHPDLDQRVGVSERTSGDSKRWILVQDSVVSGRLHGAVGGRAATVTLFARSGLSTPASATSCRMRFEWREAFPGFAFGAISGGLAEAVRTG